MGGGATRKLQVRHDVLFRQMRNATQDFSRFESDILSACERFKISADVGTRGCKEVPKLMAWEETECLCRWMRAQKRPICQMLNRSIRRFPQCLGQVEFFKRWVPVEYAGCLHCTSKISPVFHLSSCLRTTGDLSENRFFCSFVSSKLVFDWRVSDRCASCWGFTGQR